mgnify:CR=1 FL=1
MLQNITSNFGIHFFYLIYIDWIAVGYALIAAAMPVLAVFMALHNGVKGLNASRKDDENEQ